MATVLRTHEQLGQALRQRRKALGLTQADVARRLGVSQTRLSAFERRADILSVRQLLALAALLDIRLLLDVPTTVPDATALSARRAKETSAW